MKKPQYDNLISFYHKIESERESPQKTASELAVHHPIDKWMPGDVADAGIEDAQELLPKSGRLCFIPLITANYIFLDFGKETQAVYHFLFSIAP